MDLCHLLCTLRCLSPWHRTSSTSPFCEVPVPWPERKTQERWTSRNKTWSVIFYSVNTRTPFPIFKATQSWLRHDCHSVGKCILYHRYHPWICRPILHLHLLQVPIWISETFERLSLNLTLQHSKNECSRKKLKLTMRHIFFTSFFEKLLGICDLLLQSTVHTFHLQHQDIALAICNHLKVLYFRRSSSASAAASAPLGGPTTRTIARARWCGPLGVSIPVATSQSIRRGKFIVLAPNSRSMAIQQRPHY